MNWLLFSLFFSFAAPAFPQDAIMEGTVESNGKPDLYVSTTNSRVGISTGIPQCVLDVEGTTCGTGFGLSNGLLSSTNTWSAQQSFTAAVVVSSAFPNITTYVSGSGTYTVPTINGAAATLLHYRLKGGGGGGSGSGTSPSAATGGGATTFATATIYTSTANGGAKGDSGVGGGSGGSNVVGSNCQISWSGGSGGNGTGNGNSNGGNGGGGHMGSPGGGGTSGANIGMNADAISGTGGAGGGGAGAGATGPSGTGGGEGAYCEGWINNPAASYSYSVGGAGSAGGAGTGGAAGGGGSGGFIVIEAYWH